jgi:hypothetical protein
VKKYERKEERERGEGGGGGKGAEFERKAMRPFFFAQHNTKHVNQPVANLKIF